MDHRVGEVSLAVFLFQGFRLRPARPKASPAVRRIHRIPAQTI
jgi:hypothetical protein